MALLVHCFSEIYYRIWLIIIYRLKGRHMQKSPLEKFFPYGIHGYSRAKYRFKSHLLSALIRRIIVWILDPRFLAYAFPMQWLKRNQKICYWRLPLTKSHFTFLCGLISFSVSDCSSRVESCCLRAARGSWSLFPVVVAAWLLLKELSVKSIQT